MVDDDPPPVVAPEPTNIDSADVGDFTLPLPPGGQDDALEDGAIEL